MLDPHQRFLMIGQHDANDSRSRGEIKPEKVLQLRLSAEILEQLTREDVKIKLNTIDDTNTILIVNDVQHSLQKTAEASPHHLYQAQLEQQAGPSRTSGNSQLMHIGEVKTKYAIRPNSTPSSSATSRLKERREMEEARKMEHRAVLLDSAPVSNKPAKSSSGLKLRPKGLAPANKGSPLLQSRSGTPIESYSHSLPASPNLGSVNDLIQNTPTNQTKSSPLKRESSPPALRRQLIQLLAKGPLARRDIVRDVHFAEPQVISFLGRIATTPDHLQPKSSSSSTIRKFTGPVNRRGSSTSSTLARGTILLLRFVAFEASC